MSESREQRLAENEVVFRTLNENISVIAGTLGGEAPYEFVCECATSACFDRLTLTMAEYEEVRRNGARFLVRAGHEDLEVEQVVEAHPEFVVVEKDGVAGILATDEDPRA